jgi:hypothetical protein
MKIKPADRKVALALMIDPLPAAVRGEVFLDNSFCSRFGISPKFWFALDAEHSVETGSLHNALRKALAGKKTAMLALRDGRRVCAKRSRRGHNAQILLGNRGFGFPDSDLLSLTKATRIKALKRVLATRPLLPTEEKKWLAIGEERTLQDREYIELMTNLAATPEGFRAMFAKPKDLDSDMLLPDAPEYYARLIAPMDNSKELDTFIGGALATARGALLQKSPAIALRRIAYSALWQPLIPFDLLQSLRLSDVSALLKANDPFSLLCGFELCRALVAGDPGFVDLGTQFLSKLLLDKEASVRRCTLFATFALIATVNIRNAAKASDAPLFWVRLAALTHAGLMTDALSAIPDAEGMLRWASKNFAPSYLWSTVVDLRDAPRWSPEWIDPDYLQAELVGRIQGAIQLLSEGDRPAAWVDALDAALAQLKDSGKLLAAFFAGPFDDFRANTTMLSSNIEVFAEVEKKLETSSTLPAWNELFSLVSASRPSERFVGNVRRILSAPPDEPIVETSELAHVRLCARIGAIARDEPIAGAVINRCLLMLRQSGRQEAFTDVFEVMIEACAAYAAPDAYRKQVGETAAQICGAADNDPDFNNLQGIFDALSTRDEKLMPSLARARAIARVRTAG